MTAYPKHLIEVDLPIKRNRAMRAEKPIRHGHISTLHIWWARGLWRPAAAVMCGLALARPGRPELPAELSRCRVAIDHRLR